MGKKHTVFLLLALLAATLLGCCEADVKKEEATNTNKGSIRPSANAQQQPIAATSNSPYKDQILKLGRIPYTNPSNMVVQHEAFLKYLAEEIGVKGVRLQTASDYSSIMKKLLAGEIDIAWMASLSAVEARNNPEVELLCKPIRYGTTSYRGIVIARQDSGIRTLKDLKDKKFAWVDKESASAYLFPKAMFIEANIDPDRDFSEVEILGKHDAVVYNVLLGKYDAGACYDDARNTLKDKSKKEIQDYRIYDGDTLEFGQTYVTIHITDGDRELEVLDIHQPIAVGTRSGLLYIEITEAPTKTVYKEGEEFDRTGMIVTATYVNGEKKEIQDYAILKGEALELGQEYVIVHVREDDRELEVLDKQQKIVVEKQY